MAYGLEASAEGRGKCLPSDWVNCPSSGLGLAVGLLVPWTLGVSIDWLSVLVSIQCLSLHLPSLMNKHMQ